MKRIWKALLYSLKGLRTALTHETAFQQELHGGLGEKGETQMLVWKTIIGAAIEEVIRKRPATPPVLTGIE